MQIRDREAFYEQFGIRERYDDPSNYGERNSHFGNGRYPPDWEDRRSAVWWLQDDECARCGRHKYAVDELYAPGYRTATKRAGAADALRSREDYKALLAEWQTAFPDAACEIVTAVEQGDTVMCFWRLTGTHERAFRGLEPTGERIAADGFSLRRFEDGRVVESADVIQLLYVLAQLGADLPHAVAD